MSRDQFRNLTAKRGMSVTRFNLFLKINALLSKLRGLEIHCEVWIDGSFVTEKTDPSDVDVSLMIDEAVFDGLSDEAREFVLELSHLDEKYDGVLDLFVCIVYPRGSENRTLDPPEGYSRLWSVGHDERHLKGFIVLEVPDGIY